MVAGKDRTPPPSGAGGGLHKRIVDAALVAPAGAPSAIDISFIVPNFNAGTKLAATIESIRSDAPDRSEVIVVDDGSTDDSLEWARDRVDVIIARPCQGGAARARNDGGRVARGKILFFVDSDVTVRPGSIAGALRRINEGADAVFGSYGALPPPAVRNAATNYKNLIHHYTHQFGSTDAQTFWSGFGAVTRDAFFAVRGFDPAVTTGADVEDIHLGYRLTNAGFHIRLDPDLLVDHHKEYTSWGVVVSDVKHRAIPWTQAMMELGTYTADLNLRRRAMVSAGLAYGAAIGLVSSVRFGRRGFAIGLGSLLAWATAERKFLAYARREWSLGGAFISATHHFLYYLYSVAGAGAGVVKQLFVRDQVSVRNHLRLDRRPSDEPVLVTIAVVAHPGEPIEAIQRLPEPDSWWELIVVTSEEIPDLPSHAKVLHVPARLSRQERRQEALDGANGDAFIALDANCEPDPGWMDRVRYWAGRHELVVGGSVDHDSHDLMARAHHTAAWFDHRSQRQAHWILKHSSNNALFRTDVLRDLGGFHEEGAVMLRMAAFGANPIRFDPELRVRITESVSPRRLVEGRAWAGRVRASAVTRYLGMSPRYRYVLAGLAPVRAVAAIGRTAISAVREGEADAQFWRSFPAGAAGIAAYWGGRALGHIDPASRGGVVPLTEADVERIASERHPAIVGELNGR